MRAAQDTPGAHIGAWLKSRRGTLLLLAALGAIVLAVCALYALPLEALGYAGLLCLILILFAAAADFARFSARHRQLALLRQALPESLEHLPEPKDLVEQRYQALLDSLVTLYRDQATRDDARLQAMTGYYSLWSHQIKTPLAAMRLLLQEDSARARRLAGELFKVEQYVDMALGFMRLENRASDFVFAACPLGRPVARAARRFAAQFVAKRLSLSTAVPEDARAVTDEKWLQFMLEQLLSNAVKYTAAGGVSILWDEDARELVIRDTGPGIAAEDLPRVFEMGFTGYTGRMDRQATGIGLFLCKQTASRLGLGLSLSSRPGQGTRAVIAFPKETLTAE